MKIEPELPSHPKYLMLRAKIGPEALEYLIRLWGHCECSKRGEWWAGADSSYVEAVCQTRKRPGLVYAALLSGKWIHEDSQGGVSGVRIHQWNETNWRAVSNWELGSRPKTKAHALVKPTGSQGLPTGSSPLTELSEVNELSDVRFALACLFGRVKDSPWSYAEEAAMLEVARRPEIVAEAREVIAYRRGLPPERVQFFPRSLSGVLSRWPETLDIARSEKGLKKNAAAGGHPPGWIEGDQDWWWVDSLDSLKATLTGASLKGDTTTSVRLHAILKARTERD